MLSLNPFRKLSMVSLLNCISPVECGVFLSHTNEFSVRARVSAKGSGSSVVLLFPSFFVFFFFFVAVAACHFLPVAYLQNTCSPSTKNRLFPVFSRLFPLIPPMQPPFPNLLYALFSLFYPDPFPWPMTLFGTGTLWPKATGRAGHVPVPVIRLADERSSPF